MRIVKWLSRYWDRHGPARRLTVFEGESLPSRRLPWRDLILVREDNEDWSVGFRCPCGCGEAIELAVMDGAAPRWDVAVDGKGRPTLRPSVWRQRGCRSHFWVHKGRIHWCD
ncbi:DUF6527 family protein [Aminobacter niigataensis]|uniref:DUF6527 family protein n=1 Tax=Aminobacter niigataensis TaxID=83265 RepID=UPI001FE9EA8D|nr:DUF6527 family protein [Aminobacter niigataensis]